MLNRPATITKAQIISRNNLQNIHRNTIKNVALFHHIFDGCSDYLYEHLSLSYLSLNQLLIGSVLCKSALGKGGVSPKAIAHV